MDKIDITLSLLSDLKEKAERAIPGPWDYCGYESGNGNVELTIGAEKPGQNICKLSSQLYHKNCLYNAAFIAAANPAVVLALIRRILELEKEIEARHKIIQEDDGRIEEAEGKCLLLKEKISRLEQENARLKIEAHDLDSSGRETAKDLEQLEKEAGMLAAFCADLCPNVPYYINCQSCDSCPGMDCEKSGKPESWRELARKMVEDPTK